MKKNTELNMETQAEYEELHGLLDEDEANVEEIMKVAFGDNFGFQYWDFLEEYDRNKDFAKMKKQAYYPELAEVLNFFFTEMDPPTPIGSPRVSSFGFPSVSLNYSFALLSSLI